MTTPPRSLDGSPDKDPYGLVDLGSNATTTTTSATTSTTTSAVSDRFNQPKNQGTGSSRTRSAEYHSIEEDSLDSSCCQKVGDCFRGFFSTKTKTL